MRFKAGKSSPRRLLALAMFPLLLCPAAHSQKFLPDDPLSKEPDIPIVCPQEVKRSEVGDFFESVLKEPPEIRHAQNANTLGEVPDSSWFTNRIGRRPMTLEELARGPNQVQGPDLSKPLLVTSAKTEGRSLGFVAKDARGDTYFIKLDPAGWPQLTTSTGVIGARFFHAFGYNVPEDYLAFIQPQDLTIDPKSDDPEKLKATLARILELAARRPDGAYQIIASRELPGKPLGPFKFIGTRSDDPNDHIAHENRRELRGLRVFSAWLNHTDSKSLNTLDTFVSNGKDDRGFVRHYLIDFGSSLGAGAQGPKPERRGHELLVDWIHMFRSITSLGLWQPSWTEIEFAQHPVSGHFEWEVFEPSQWKPLYWNQAFERMTSADAFWAAKIISRFTPEMIRTIARTGQISNRADEDHLVEALVQRQRKILNHYFGEQNPLDEFRVSGRRLVFRNLGESVEQGRVASYRFQWFEFDNGTGALQDLGPERAIQTASIPVPEPAGRGYLMVRISTESPDYPSWNGPVDVYLRNGSQVVGVERAAIESH